MKEFLRVTYVSGSSIYNNTLLVFPLIMTVIIFKYNIFCLDNIASNIIAAIALFIAIIFSTIFQIPDKVNKRIILYQNNKDEEVCIFLKRYKSFATDYVNKITYITLLSGVIIILLLIISTTKLYDSLFCRIIYRLLHCFTYFFLFQWVIIISNVIITTCNITIADINLKKLIIYT